MIIEINKCSDCPFFNENQSLDHGLYQTGEYYPSCDYCDHDFGRQWSDTIEDIIPPNVCPIRDEGIFIKLNEKKFK
jgi:hypothetical protein